VPILEVLRARDAERSSAALREHFEHYARWVVDPALDEPDRGG
jgi:DNA-binding GntR family transcriptional regulator